MVPPGRVRLLRSFKGLRPGGTSECPTAPSGRKNEVGAPNVSASLENYATILRKTGQDNEAAKMELGAMGIRYKHGKENP